MQDVNLVLADRYQARERLGSGAGAGVEEYLGRDLRLARPVVIQVIRGAGKDGFAPQARLMASLDHPAVASVYDWGQQEGLAYLIREYVPGQNLGRLLIERGVLPVPQAAAIGAEVAAAWMREAAGVAPERLDTTRAGGPGATGGPAAPGGREPGAQADLRALGGMLYQMITGASPEQWPMVTPMAGAGLSPPLRQVIERLMAPEPADRYRAAEAVRADLLHLTHGQAASAQPAAPASGKPVPAGSAAAGPASTTAPVRVPADAPPSWVSATQGTARPGSAARGGPPGGDALEDQDAEGRRRRRWVGVWLGVILGLALLAGAVGGALLLTRDPGDRATVKTPGHPGPTSITTVQAAELPDVVGLDEQVATSTMVRIDSTLPTTPRMSPWVSTWKSWSGCERVTTSRMIRCSSGMSPGEIALTAMPSTRLTPNRRCAAVTGMKASWLRSTPRVVPTRLSTPTTRKRTPPMVTNLPSGSRPGNSSSAGLAPSTTTRRRTAMSDSLKKVPRSTVRSKTKGMVSLVPFRFTCARRGPTRASSPEATVAATRSGSPTASPMRRTSSRVRRERAGAEPMEKSPGATNRMLEPSDSMPEVTSLRAPLPIATSSTTLVTPITTPSMVRPDRSLLAWSASHASRTASVSLTGGPPPPGARRGPAGCGRSGRPRQRRG